MATVHRLPHGTEDVTLGQAADAYLATLRGAEHASTRRTYGRILRRVVTEFGVGPPPGIDAGRLAAWFGAQWGGGAPSTWNVSLVAIRSAATYWQRQGWITADPSRMLKRRKPRPDHARALSVADVEQLLTRKDISLRERTLWRMLYETAARSAEVLALDVEDLDLPNRRAKVRRKGGAMDVDHLADRHRPAPAAPAQGPHVGAGVRHRAQGPRAARRSRPGRERPRQAQLPAGRRPVLRGLRRGRRCTSSVTRRSPTTPRTAPARRC